MDVAVTAPRLQNLPNAYAATHLSASTRFGSNQRAHVSIFRSARVAPEKAVFRPALPLRSAPGLNGTTMTKLTYKEQLLHPNWQRKRLERLTLADWKCESCSSGDETLHVHHKRYFKGRLAWEYELSELRVLCAGCHEYTHDIDELLSRVLVEVDLGPLPAELGAAGLIAGFCAAHAGAEESAAGEARDRSSGFYDIGVLACAAGLSQLAELAKTLRVGKAPNKVIDEAIARNLKGRDVA
jgi:hypothetical protein